MQTYRLFALSFALAGGAGCSLAIHDSTDQCAVDADCSRFGGPALCREGVCVPSGLGPPGCFPGTPTNDAQFRKSCTTAQCFAFDNCARIGVCDASTPLPAPVPPPVSQ